MKMTAENSKSEQFQALLREKGLKYTFERKCIYEEVMHVHDHFDADSLYERFKKKGLRISRDTVYRTLPLLLESQVIQKSAGTGKGEFYECVGVKGHHDHMVCIHCGKIIEFQCPEIEKLQVHMCKQHNFKLVFHDHRLFGICGDCRQE